MMLDSNIRNNSAISVLSEKNERRRQNSLILITDLYREGILWGACCWWLHSDSETQETNIKDLHTNWSRLLICPTETRCRLCILTRSNNCFQTLGNAMYFLNKTDAELALKSYKGEPLYGVKCCKLDRIINYRKPSRQNMSNFLTNKSPFEDILSLLTWNVIPAS